MVEVACCNAMDRRQADLQAGSGRERVLSAEFDEWPCALPGEAFLCQTFLSCDDPNSSSSTRSEAGAEAGVSGCKRAGKRGHNLCRVAECRARKFDLDLHSGKRLSSTLARNVNTA